MAVMHSSNSAAGAADQPGPMQDVRKEAHQIRHERRSKLHGEDLHMTM